MIQLRGFLGTLLRPLLKTGLPLMKNVIQPLANSVLIPVGLAAAAKAADVGIHEHMLGFGTTLIISNYEAENIMKIVKSLEDCVLLLKGVSKTIQNEVKEQKGSFLNILLGTLGASLSRNMLSGKGIKRSEEGFIGFSYGSKRSSIKDF